MPGHEPIRFAGLAVKVRAEPAQRERIAQRRRALEAALRLAEVRARRRLTQQEVAAVFPDETVALIAAVGGTD